MSKNYRLYSFVANLYLNEKQFGIQTGHAMGEMIHTYVFHDGKEKEAIRQFLDEGKTWIILGALNQKGVLDAFDAMCLSAPSLSLPYALFCEDEDSMNNMATCAVVLVPQELYDAQPNYDETGRKVLSYEYIDETGMAYSYWESSAKYTLITLIKSGRLA